MLAAEWVLRISMPSEYYVWNPGYARIFRPSPGTMPGIEGESRFTINSAGIRGEEFSGRQGYRILAIGGSTTECLYLDDLEAWPRLLQDYLNDQLNRTDIWVGNVGVSGHNSEHHILQIDKLVAQYPRIDMVVVLVGGNDLGRWLAMDGRIDELEGDPPAQLARSMDKAFRIRPSIEAGDPFYELSALSALWKKVRHGLGRGRATAKAQDEAGSLFINWRKARQDATEIRPTLPDNTDALQEYRENLRAIVDLSRDRGIELILMTQPAMWHADLPEYLVRLLWMGGAGDFGIDSPSAYYSPGALAEGIAAYNSALLSICDNRNISCLDLASVIPRDTSSFYDDMHFNEIGARLVTESLGNFIIDRNLIRQRATSVTGAEVAETLAGRSADNK